jgi:hypothetical protein
VAGSSGLISPALWKRSSSRDSHDKKAEDHSHGRKKVTSMAGRCVHQRLSCSKVDRCDSECDRSSKRVDRRRRIIPGLSALSAPLFFARNAATAG